MDEILYHPKHHGKPLFVGIYRGELSFQGFLGGAGFRPSTVSGLAWDPCPEMPDTAASGRPRCRALLGARPGVIVEELVLATKAGRPTQGIPYTVLGVFLPPVVVDLFWFSENMVAFTIPCPIC